MAKFFLSFRYAFRGLVSGFQGGRNLKIQLAAAFGALALGVFLNIGSARLGLVLLISGAILSLELFNTALERLVDQIHPEHKTEIGDVKDILAGGVLLLSMISVLIGLLVFTGPLMQLL